MEAEPSERIRALSQLRAETPHQRLQAARVLRRIAVPADNAELTAALRVESVTWVRKAILAVLNSLAAAADSENKGPDQPTDYDIPEKALKQIYGRALEEISGTILHEFQGVIGILKLRAKEEIADFPTSQTKFELDRLDRLVKAVEGLKKAAAAPRRRQFDLSQLVEEIVQAEIAGIGVDVSRTGPAELLTSGDPELVRLAICNGLRNAIDAVQSLPANDGGHAVVLNWGRSDIETWLVILDRGPGLPQGGVGAFELGTTTKAGHTGMGLPIARQAMESLDGTVSLTPAAERGARFEIRWGS